MTIKLKDIASQANVSKATVSLALNNSKLVSDETAKRVREIARDLGYSPNAMARGLVKQKSGTIGLIVPDIESAYYGKLVKCIDESLRDAGYNLVLAISNDKPEIERKIVGNLISERVEGIIIAPVNQYNEELGYIKQLDTHGIPCVFISSYYDELDEPYVMVDLEEGTYKLVKYLLDLGHRRIVFLTGSPKVLTTSHRINGYRRAFEEKNLSFDEAQLIECKRLNYEYSCDVAKELLKNRSEIDAVITINDMMALGIVNTFRNNGVDVPNEISVAGYDNIIFSVISPVPITTVAQDIRKMSRLAVDIIVSKLENPGSRKENILIKPDLVIRDSTGGVRK
jgi:LacI family transcriptional regulator